MNIQKIILLLSVLLLINCHPGHGQDHDPNHDHDHDHDHDHNHDHDHDHDSHQTVQSAKYVTQSGVLKLTTANLQDAIDEFPLILIKFFAPWCGHCKTLAVPYQEAAQKLSESQDTKVVLAQVDCTLHQQICTKFSIRGYPTLKYFVDGQTHDYAGRRTVESIVEWTQSKAVEVRAQQPIQKIEQL